MFGKSSVDIAHLIECAVEIDLSVFSSSNPYCVIRRKLEPLTESCEGIGLHDFRCYLRVASLSLTPL